MEVLQNKKQTDTSYSDLDLFVLMSFREENEIEAQDAFRILYDRYKDFLWYICAKVSQNRGFCSEELAKDVFSQTMIAIYHSAHTYDEKKSKITTWISCIARNEMYDILYILKEKKIGEKEFVPINEDLSISNNEENDHENNEINTPQKDALNKGLERLSEKERDILLTYMMYKDENKHLPDEVIQSLCHRHGITSVNLRQIKKRALEKLMNYISQNTNLLKS